MLALEAPCHVGAAERSPFFVFKFYGTARVGGNEGRYVEDLPCMSGSHMHIPVVGREVNEFLTMSRTLRVVHLLGNKFVISLSVVKIPALRRRPPPPGL